MARRARARSAVLAFLLAGLSVRAERPSRVGPASQLGLDAVEVRARGHFGRQRVHGSGDQAALDDPPIVATPCDEESGNGGGPESPTPALETTTTTTTECDPVPSPTPDDSSSPTPSPDSLETTTTTTTTTERDPVPSPTPDDSSSPTPSPDTQPGSHTPCDEESGNGDGSESPTPAPETTTTTTTERDPVPSPTPDDSSDPTPSPSEASPTPSPSAGGDFDVSKSTCYEHTAEGVVASDEGNSVGEFPGASVEACRAECSKNPSCLSFSHTSKWNGLCYLKDKQVTKDSPTKANSAQFSTYYKARCPACSPSNGSQKVSGTCECAGVAVCNAGQRCSAEKACHNKPGDGPVKYGTDWKDLITGTSCPPSTQLTPKSGGPAGAITCASTSQGRRHFKFPPGEFDIDEQVAVPAGTTIEGNANPNDPSDRAKKPDHSTQTFFVATHGVDNFETPYCGTNNNLRPGQAQKLRIGFLLNSNTVVKNINFQGRDTIRPRDNGSLCGGAAFETPGCVSEGYAVGKGDGYVHRPGCRDRKGRSNGLVTGDGRGVENVVIDSVRLNDMLGDKKHGTQIAVWVAQTKDSSFTRNVTVTNLVSMLTRGDGINFHGDVRDSVVENCHVQDTGDDIYAVWGGYKNPTGLVFRNNVGKNAGFARDFTYGVCIAVYGAKEVSFTGMKCYDPPQNTRTCVNHGQYCNGCLAYVHDNYFGAVYPGGNKISFSGNEYLNMDGSRVSDGRPMVRDDKHGGSRANIVQ